MHEALKVNEEEKKPEKKQQSKPKILVTDKGVKLSIMTELRPKQEIKPASTVKQTMLGRIPEFENPEVEESDPLWMKKKKLKKYLDPIEVEEYF